MDDGTAIRHVLEDRSDIRQVFDDRIDILQILEDRTGILEIALVLTKFWNVMPVFKRLHQQLSSFAEVVAS